MSQPLTNLLDRFRKAQPLIAERERLVTEALGLIRDAAEGLSSPVHFLAKLSLLRSQVAFLNAQIAELLPLDREPQN